MGHSFGALAIICSHEQNFDSAVFLDPTYDISFTKGDEDFPSGEYNKKLDSYIMHWGVNILIGRAMAEEVDSMKWDMITCNFSVPFKIFIAGKGELKKAKNYLKATKAETDLCVMKEANHYFNNKPGLQEKVFIMSEKWFRLFV